MNALPVECTIQIISYFQPKEVVPLLQTCKFFHMLQYQHQVFIQWLIKSQSNTYYKTFLNDHEFVCLILTKGYSQPEALDAYLLQTISVNDVFKSYALSALVNPQLRRELLVLASTEIKESPSKKHQIREEVYGFEQFCTLLDSWCPDFKKEFYPVEQGVYSSHWYNLNLNAHAISEDFSVKLTLVHNDNLFITDNNHVIRAHAATGAIKWTIEVHGTLNSCHVFEEKLFVSFFDETQQNACTLTMLNQETGVSEKSINLGFISTLEWLGSGVGQVKNRYIFRIEVQDKFFSIHKSELPGLGKLSIAGPFLCEQRLKSLVIYKLDEIFLGQTNAIMNFPYCGDVVPFYHQNMFHLFEDNFFASSLKSYDHHLDIPCRTSNVLTNEKMLIYFIDGKEQLFIKISNLSCEALDLTRFTPKWCRENHFDVNQAFLNQKNRLLILQNTVTGSLQAIDTKSGNTVWCEVQRLSDKTEIIGEDREGLLIFKSSTNK